jgi:GTPase SAR1 family protein
MADLKKVLAKIILLGDMGVGKTTLLNGYAGGSSTGAASIGPDFRKKDLQVGNFMVNM